MTYVLRLGMILHYRIKQHQLFFAYTLHLAGLLYLYQIVKAFKIQCSEAFRIFPVQFFDLPFKL